MGERQGLAKMSSGGSFMSMIVLFAAGWLALVVFGWSLFAVAARADRRGWQRPPPPPRR
jgi:hypothetical protein